MKFSSDICFVDGNYEKWHELFTHCRSLFKLITQFSIHQQLYGIPVRVLIRLECSPVMQVVIDPTWTPKRSRVIYRNWTRGYMKLVRTQKKGKRKQISELTAIACTRRSPRRGGWGFPISRSRSYRVAAGV